MNAINLPEGLRAQLREHFVMLEPEGVGRRYAALPLRVEGYTGVMHLIADLVRVAILALNANGNPTTAHIPEPESNIGGMLAMILDLLPYEEAELLDRLRAEILSPTSLLDDDEDFVLACIMVTPEKVFGRPVSPEGFCPS